MAILKWRNLRGSYRVSAPCLILSFSGIFSVFLASGPSGQGENAPDLRTWEAARAEQAYQKLQKQWQQSPTNTQLAWQFARTCFDAAEFSKNNSERARLARQGMAACEQAIREDPKLGPAHYYLAMNMGQLAQTERLAALRLIRDMETEFKAASALSPGFDYAGPERALGMLYREAPGWPTGVGSHHKAVDELQKAVQIAPDYPDNWLTLVETFFKSGDRRKATAELPRVEQRMVAARQKFTGDEWKWDWQDWDRRWEKIKAKAALQMQESPRTRTR